MLPPKMVREREGGRSMRMREGEGRERDGGECETDDGEGSMITSCVGGVSIIQ